MKKTPAKRSAKNPFGDEVYKKVGGRYIPVGHEWRGFPADGIWLVSDGKSNMTCLIGLKEKVPVFALNYLLHEDALCRLIQDSMKKGGLSFMDEARLCCIYFAEVAARQEEK
jgi:hypothetical protein